MGCCGSGKFLSLLARIVALCSLLLGIIVFGLSSWILHKSLQMKKNHELNGKEFLIQVNTFFGGVAGSAGPSVYDYDIIFRILISTTASALIGGACQVLFSLGLFLATIRGGRASYGVGKMWVYAHVVVMLVIGSATLCILTNELELNSSIRIFMISSGGDALLLILFMWVIYSWSFRDEDDFEDDEIKSRTSRRASRIYHSPPGYTTNILPPMPPTPNGGLNARNDGNTTPIKNSEDFREVKLRPVSVV